MSDKCICTSPNFSLKNIHFKKENIEMILLKDDDGYGTVILKNNIAIACFDINYCPVCGKNLKERYNES